MSHAADMISVSGNGIKNSEGCLGRDGDLSVCASLQYHVFVTMSRKVCVCVRGVGRRS